MDFLLPPWLKQARVGFRYLDATGVSRGEFGGPPRTGTRGGDRLAATLQFTPQMTSSVESALERRAMVAFLARLQGRQHRAHLTNPARRLAGSFSGSELVANPTMANGTTGYATGSFTLTVADRQMRATRFENVGSVTSVARLSANLTVTQYAPHVLRVMAHAGRGSFADLSLRAGNTDNGIEYGQSGTLSPGLLSFAFTPYDTVCRAGLYQGANTLSVAGDYLGIPYFSIARCALVDNSPNAFQRSDELENAYWTAPGLTSRTANTTAAPDGTTTADTLLEDALAGQHNISKSETRASAAEDWCATAMVKRGSGTRNFGLVIGRDGGTNFTRCLFDLGAVTVGTITNNGDNTNGRGFIRNMGNGWFACHLVARLTASTGVFLQAEMLSGTADSYTGDGTSQLHLWRVGAARSSVPFRLGQTTTAATTGTAQTGNGIHLKGLPVSTNGLLLPSDEAEVITSFGSELKLTQAALNSDAAGLGYWQFGPPIRGVLADNAPVIIHEPYGYFLFSGDAVGWDHEPGVVTTASADFEEAA